MIVESRWKPSFKMAARYVTIIGILGTKMEFYQRATMVDMSYSNLILFFREVVERRVQARRPKCRTFIAEICCDWLKTE